MPTPNIKWSDIFDFRPQPDNNADDAPLVLVYKQGQAAGREASPNDPTVRVAYDATRRIHGQQHTVRMSTAVKKSRIIWEMRNGPVLAGHKIIQLATGDRNRPQLSELRCVPEDHPEPKRSPLWKEPTS